MEKTSKRKTYKRISLLLLVWIMSAVLILSAAAATSGNGSTGDNGFSWSWNTDNTNTNAAGTFSGTLNGTTLVCNVSASSSTYVEEKKDTCGNVTQQLANAANTTVTATVTNNTGSTIKITSITCDKATVPELAVGQMIESGKTFTVKLTASPSSSTATSSTTATGTATITYTVVENIEVTFYGAANITYTVGENIVSGEGNFTTVPQTPGASITLPDVTVSSGTFMGWRMSDGSIQQSGASAIFNSDSSVYPVVLSGNEIYPYTVNGTAYCFWEDAAYAAGTSGTIILNQDYTLPTTMAANGVSPNGGQFVKKTDTAVSYIVPQGVTLLIPYDDAHTLYTTDPALVIDNAAVVTPTAFRTLTMAEGSHIIIEGAMSLSGEVHAYMGSRYQNSAPTGPSGFVKMEKGSSITVKGALYAWGYIVGSGSVIAESGSTIYECFQVRDWRGGDALSSMTDNTQRVFPVSQYYVQNIEVPLTLKYGAKEKGFLATYVSKMKKTAVFTFIGSDGMFRIADENSSITKKYDGTTDRLIVDVNGNTTMSSIVISIDTGLIGSVTLNSANYVLPINSNITVSIHEGSSVVVEQDIALLPGSNVEIEQGAQLTLGEGKNVFVYDQDDWGTYCVGNVKFRAVCWAYSRSYTRKETDLVDAKIIVNGYIDASAGMFYTTTGGANICSTGNGSIKLAAATDTTTYQATQSGTDISYSEVGANSAKLLNSDSTYLSTASSTASPNTYTYTDGKWICQTHTDVDNDSVCDVCGYVLCAHDNTELQGNKEATCTEDGYTGDTVCTSCGKIVETGNTIESAGHNYETVTNAATCTVPGSKVSTCTVCGDVQTESISASGHTASGTWLTNEDNTKHYQTCKTCGEVAIEGTHSGGTATCMTPATCDVCKQSYGSVDNNNHNFSAEWSTDENGHWKVCLNGCSVKGSAGNHTGGTANCVDMAVCETCQTAYGNVDGSNHKTVKTDAAQAPDCTNTGLTEGSHCEACNTVIAAQTTVDALGHEPGAEATCTTAQTCIRCAYVYQAALGHSYTNYVSNNDAKCEVDGTETAQCDRCNETHTRIDEGSALGHSYTSYTLHEAATCQRNETQIASCDNGCGGTNIKTIENSTVDHSYGDYVSDNNATCLNNGTQTAKCIWCEETDTVTVEDSALGHNWGEYISDGNATCLNDGTMTRTCGRCKLTETVTETGSALGHSFTNYVPNGDAVCGKDGTKTATCDRCDATDTVDNEGSALVHQFTNYTYNNDAKCGVDGTKTAVCDYECGATDTITAEGTALTHSYTNYVSNGDATCTQDGTKSAYCIHGCGTKDTVADEGSALGHNFTNYVPNNNATCTANGTETGTCSRCDAINTREIPNSILPHSYTNYTSNGDATCTADGTKTAKCDYCTSTTTVTDAGSMLEHSYGDWIVETSATCTAEGSSRRECSICDAFETRVDAATNHSMGDWYISTPTTCESSGEKRRACAVCEYYETEVIEALSHNYTSAVTKQPTCVDKGVETFTCSNCQNSYTQEIAATGVHTEATREENRMEATCGADGSYNLVTYCSVCTQVLKTEAKVIPATGAHNYESEVTVEPTCIAVGERTYTCTVCQDSYTEEIEKAPHTVSQEYTTENGKHYHKCTTEGCTYVEDEAECSGGEATCKDLAVCEICSEAYGELDPKNHVGGTTIKDASAATCTTPGYTGDTYCLGCDTKIADGESIPTASHHYSSSVTKEATCVEAGVRTYTCSGCGYSYTEEIPATDHSNVTDATEWLSDDTNHWQVCPDCQEKVNVAAHSYADGVCSVCRATEIIADPITVAYSMQAFLQLKSEVIMGVGFKLENLGDIDPHSLENRVGLLIWNADELPAESEATIKNCSYVIDSAKYNTTEKRYEALSLGIPAKDLGNLLAFRAYYIDNNGNYVYGRIISSYSPRTYCYNKLNPAKDSDTSNDAIMIAILNYCTAAQEFFASQPSYGYTIDTYINDGLTDEQKQLIWDGSLIRSDWSIPAEKEGTLTRNRTVVTSRGANLTLKGAIDYTYYFKASGIDVASAEILTWTEAAYNSVTVLTAENATIYPLEYVSTNSRYEYVYKGLPAKDMFSPIYACAKFTDTDGNVYYSGVVSYCPERYSSLNYDDTNTYIANLAKWIVIYGDAARSYFATH